MVVVVHTIRKAANVAEKYLCCHCSGTFTITKTSRFRKHNGAEGECMGSGETVPAHQLAKGPVGAGVDPSVPEEGRDIGTCGECESRVKLTPDGQYVEHRFGRNVFAPICGGGGLQYEPPMEMPCPTAPIVVPVTVTIANPPTSGPTHSFLQPGASSTGAPMTGVTVPASAATTPAAVSPFTQPTRRSSDADPVQPMTTLGEQITARMKEIFYAYGNRKTSDNRSAQATLGPSEIGTPCDRRLAMSLLRIPAVNPGGDGWAAFVGTAVHAALADMLLWANGDTGRFAVEQHLTFPNAFVPRGTADMLDRTLCLVADHKIQGQWSAGKLRAKGPGDTYRIQAHVYAYGLRLKGERIDDVAVISWPRDKSSLEDLWTWTEPYDASIALDALKRVDDLAAWISKCELDGATPVEIAKYAAITPDCTYCPFHAPGDVNGTRGCNGKE